MTLQNTDYFLVNRAGTSYRYTWDDIQEDVELSLQIEDVFSFTGTKGATTKAETLVPIDIDNGIRLPVAGTGDYGVDGAIRYSPANSKIELFYSGSWNTASGGTAFGPNPPSPATEGDVWYDTDNGRAYVYYNDGNSSQWVEMNPAWDGGIPPSVIDSTSLIDGSITPSKLSPDAIVWDTAGYHAIGQAVDQTARLTVRSVNSDTSQTGLKLNQTNSTNTSTQYLEFRQDESKATSSIRVDNSSADAELEIQVGFGTKLTFYENDNIKTSVPLESASGFIGNVTGDLDGAAFQVERSATNSFDTNFYHIMFGGVTQNATPAAVRTVTDRSSLTYRPSDNRITCGLVAADLIGTADNANLLDGLAATEFFKNSGNNTASGSNTFSGFCEFTNGSRHRDQVRINFGNSNDAKIYHSGTHFYTDISVGNWYIRDNFTNRFVFGRSSGTFTATGNITAPNFIGNLSGNATSANTATTAQTTNQVNVVGVGSSIVPVLLGDDVNPGNNQDVQRDQTLFWDGTSNTLNTFNLQLTGTVQGGTYTNLRCEGTIREEVYNIPFSAPLANEFIIDPENGSFQLITLASSVTTPSESGWVAGESVTLMISNNNSSRTVNWGTLNVRWANGESPTITSSGGYTVLQLWKIGSVIYGAIVGDVV